MELSVRRLKHVLVTFVALLVAAAQVAHAEPLPDRTERVIGLARVWAKAKFFHPYLAYKDIDWDAALVAAIPKAEAATSVVEYRAAIHGMLAVLRDPVTRVLDAPAPTEAKPPPTDWLTTPSAGVVEVKIASFVAGTFDYVAIGDKATRVLREAAAAKVLIVDLRALGAAAESIRYALQPLAPLFPAVDEWPVERTIEHHGFRTQDYSGSDEYFSTFVSHGSLPPRAGPAHGVSHVVFIVDLDSYIPAEVLALQAAGRGTVVAYGGLLEDHAVSTVDVELPGKVTARVRLGELLWGTPTADVTVVRAQDLEARARALAKAVATAPNRAKPKKAMPLPLLRARDDLDYADPLYPSREHRMLAGIRMWAVLDNVYPYRYLIGDWEGVLRETLPQLADAPDRAEYLHVLRRMAVRPNDGHIGVWSATPDPAARPRGYTAIDTRMVEGKLAVVRLLDVTEARKHGLEVGDVIETINGKPAAATLAEVQREVTGSTEETRVQWAAVKALSGDDGTTVELGVRGADGKLRNVSLVRSVANAAARQAMSTSPHWKTLAGNVGYVDLRQLLIPEIDPMLEDLKATRAIVFDMRGYPNGTGRDLAPRLNTRKSTYGAVFLAPLAVGEGGTERDRRIRFLQTIVALPKDAWVYSGTIVVLINDRAISQAEHTCLFLAEAAGATFIGSPTAGANGDITVMRLPGGLRMQFTGQEVRHVDGRQLQQVGIQPDVVVRPTLAGLRAGKDEVLDRALLWLASHR